MRTYVTNYLDYIATLITEYTNQAEALKQDDRKDEANLFKVRANICDIFYKMVSASDKKITTMRFSEESAQITAFNEDYLNWFVKLPQNWQTSLDKAQKYDDVIVVKTEEIKLETALLLKKKFLELVGEATNSNSEATACR